MQGHAMGDIGQDRLHTRVMPDQFGTETPGAGADFETLPHRQVKLRQQLEQARHNPGLDQGIPVIVLRVAAEMISDQLPVKFWGGHE
jgi:hypothetical protein